MLSYGLLFVSIILLIITSGLIYQRHNPNRLRFENIENFTSTQNLENTTIPTRLIIKGQEINLSIFEANIAQNKWDTTSKGVSFLSSSPAPGQIGNSIIYGHNWNSILGDLKNVKPGDEILVTLSDGTVKSFEVEFTQTVKPSESSILNNSEDRRLTVYTCSGFLDRNRFVVTAFLTDNS